MSLVKSRKTESRAEWGGGGGAGGEGVHGLDFYFQCRGDVMKHDISSCRSSVGGRNRAFNFCRPDSCLYPSASASKSVFNDEDDKGLFGNGKLRPQLTVQYEAPPPPNPRNYFPQIQTSPKQLVRRCGLLTYLVPGVRYVLPTYL